MGGEAQEENMVDYNASKDRISHTMEQIYFSVHFFCFLPYRKNTLKSRFFAATKSVPKTTRTAIIIAMSYGNAYVSTF